MRRLVMWSGIGGWRTEAAMVDLTRGGLRASGTQLGIDPVPYRLDYGLDAVAGFVTSSLRVRVSGAGWARSLVLTHDGGGGWRIERREEGAPPGLGEAVDDLEGIREARDCDLGLSPLTNTMPVRRHRLDEGAGEAELTMAWVEVPGLGVRTARQRYEHVRREGDGAVVRFVDLGPFAGFTAELELDADGLVRHYPELARRVT